MGGSSVLEPEKESAPINASINEIKTIKPKGGKRAGAGRPMGVPNILTREIKGLAGQYGAEAVKKLKDLMRHSENEQVQLAASRELLDRGFGRPGQEIGVKTGGVIVHVNRQQYQALPLAVQVATVTMDAESSDPDADSLNLEAEHRG
jgi:hypothetical protein